MPVRTDFYLKLLLAAVPDDDLTRAAEAYTASLNSHIAYMREAGRQLGVSEQQLAEHDASKWGEAEFFPYAVHFYGGEQYAAVAQTAFEYAWLHHMHHNPHHWQHWLLQNDDGSHRALVMPQSFVLEMVADWLGASMAYTGSWDMTEWLRDNMPRMWLHPDSAQRLRWVLEDLGYTELVRQTPFAHEVERA